MAAFPAVHCPRMKKLSRAAIQRLCSTYTAAYIAAIAHLIRAGKRDASRPLQDSSPKCYSLGIESNKISYSVNSALWKISMVSLSAEVLAISREVEDKMQAARDAQAERARQEKMADRVEARKRLREVYRPVIPRVIWEELGLKARIEEGDCHSTLDYQGLSAWVVYTTRDERDREAEFKMRCCIGAGGNKVDKLVVPALTDRGGELAWFPKLNRSATTEIRTPLDGCNWLDTFAYFISTWESVIPANKDFLRREEAQTKEREEAKKKEQAAAAAAAKARTALEREKEQDAQRAHSAVCEAIEVEASRIAAWRPITLYNWSFCDGAVYEEDETFCSFDYNNWATTDALDENGYITFHDSKRTLKLEPQFHKPVIEKVELLTIEAALSFAMKRNMKYCFFETLKVSVQGACPVEEDSSGLWKFERDAVGFCPDGVEGMFMPQKWLRELMGLPDFFDISVEAHARAFEQQC